MIKIGIIDKNVANDIIVSSHYNPEQLKAQRKRKGRASPFCQKIKIAKKKKNWFKILKPGGL